MTGIVQEMVVRGPLPDTSGDTLSNSAVLLIGCISLLHQGGDPQLITAVKLEVRGRLFSSQTGRMSMWSMLLQGGWPHWQLVTRQKLPDCSRCIKEPYFLMNVQAVRHEHAVPRQHSHNCRLLRMV